jgi:hypothetical protein
VAVIGWAYLLLMVAVVGLALFSALRRPPKADHTDDRVLLSLYAIRRRLEVAQFKSELRRDAADTRRALRAELQRSDRRR